MVFVDLAAWCSDAEGDLSDTMDVDRTSKSTKINTHGPRNSRREQWRMSKGMSARPERKGMNRQGSVSARRNAGRPKRRR